MFKYYKIKSSNLKMYETKFGNSYKLSIANQFISDKRLTDGFETIAWIPQFCFLKKDGNYHIFKVKVDSAYDNKLQDAKSRLIDPWGFISEIDEKEENQDE